MNEDELMSLSILLSKIYEVDISIMLLNSDDLFHLIVHQLNTDTLLSDRPIWYLQDVIEYINNEYNDKYDKYKTTNLDDIPF